MGAGRRSLNSPSSPVVASASPAMASRARDVDDYISEDSEDDEEAVDDEEFYKMQKNRIKTAAIIPERWEKDENWKPPVHPKTPEQREQIKAACTRSFMFQALTPELLETVLDAFAGPHVVEAGTEVIRQGAVVSSGEPGLYIIESGTLDVFKTATDLPHPGKKVFQYDTTGQSFGELALLYSCPRAATVMATSRSIMWSIDRDTFNNCVKGAVQEMHGRREEFLRTVEILQDLSDGDRSKIADVLQTKLCQTGDTIIVQGEVGSQFYILEEGQAHAEVTDAGVVKEYLPGECFGELALIRRQARAATVIADASPTKLASLDGESFHRLLGPTVVAKLEERTRAYQSAVEAAKARRG